MTCTQCSGSRGPAASEVPWGQERPLTKAHAPPTWTCPYENPAATAATSASWGSGPSPPARPGCAKSDGPLGPCVSALEPPPPSWGTCGALRAAPPPSLSLCCHVSLLPNRAPWPFLVLLGGGAGFLLPCAWGPQPGNGGHQVPSLHRALCPALSSQGCDQVSSGLERSPDGCSLGWQGRGISRPTSSLGTDAAPTNLCLLGGQGREKVLLPLGEGSGVCSPGPRNPASLGSAAAGGCSPQRALTSHICLDHPKALGPPPQLLLCGQRQDPFVVPYKYVYVYIDF